MQLEPPTVDTSHTPASRRAYFASERERLDQEIGAATRLISREAAIVTAYADGNASAAQEYSLLEQAHRNLPDLQRQRARIDAVLDGLAAHDHRWRQQRAVESAGAARGEFFDAMRAFREALLAAQATGEAALDVLRRVETDAFTHGTYLDRLRAQAEAPADWDVSADQREACAREAATLEAQGFPITPQARETMHGVAMLMKHLRAPEGSLNTAARFLRDSEAALAEAPSVRRRK